MTIEPQTKKSKSKAVKNVEPHVPVLDKNLDENFESTDGSSSSKKTNVSKQIDADNISLKRQFDVVVSEEDLQAKCQEKLQNLQNVARIPGYRPGKVPVNIIKAKFSQAVRDETTRELVENKVKELVEGLKLVSSPEIKDLLTQEGQGVSFSIHFEVFPEFEMPSFSSIEFEKPVAQEMSSEEINTELNKIAQSRKSFNDVDSSATVDMAVKVSVEGSMQDGTAFPFNSIEKTLLYLKDPSALSQEFNDHMLGKKADDEVEFSIDYPDDFDNANLAGKKVHYKVKIHSVHEVIIPDIGDELAKNIGYADLNSVQKDIIATYQQNFKDKAHTLLTMRLFSKLEDLLTFPVPESMQAKEIEAILEQIKKFKDSDDDLKNKSDDELVNYAKKFAARRIRVGILLNQYAQNNGIQINNADLQLAVLRNVKTMPEFMQARMLEWYSKNPKQLRSLAGEALEHKVVEDVLEKHVKFTEKLYSMHDLESAIEKETAQNMY